MAVLADIRAGIAANIKAVLPEAMVTGYALTTINVPAFEVEIESISYDEAMARGLDEWVFTVRGFAASGLDQNAQQKIDPWLDGSGDFSIKDALEADRTLGGSASDCRVIRVNKVRAYEPVASPGVAYFGAEWTLRVIAAS